MKLKRSVLLSIVMIILMLTVVGCRKPAETVIELSFDSTSAYFSASKGLMPISGEMPQEGDIYEEASVKLTSTVAVPLVLLIEFAENQTEIDGLKIAVGSEVFDFKDGITIYDSVGSITTIDLNVKIFIASNAPVSIAGKTVEFYFVMATPINI